MGESEKITRDEMAELVGNRRITWEFAADLVQPLVEQHQLEDIKSGPPFGYISTTTKVEQHISQILTVADWLLDREPR